MRYLIGSVVVILAALLLGACGQMESDSKGNAVSFGVVSPKDIPEQLQKQIEEQKKNPFQMSYLDEEYLYIAVGYGEQNTGGYSIQVDGICLDGGKIQFTSHLVGPKEDENVRRAISYPFIVVKIEKMDKEIIYQ